MSAFATVFKDEVIRLARKEVRAQAEPLRKVSAAHRREIAELKRVVAGLQRQLKLLSRPPRPASVAKTVPTANRFVAKGLVATRKRLGLSAEDLGVLAGVSGQSIRNWEAKVSTPGRENRAALIRLRALGKREARAQISQLKAQTTQAWSPGRKKPSR